MDRDSQAGSSAVPPVDPNMEVDEVSLAPTVPVAQSIPSTIVLDSSILQDTATSAHASASDATWLPMLSISGQLPTGSLAASYRSDTRPASVHSHPSVHSGGVDPAGTSAAHDTASFVSREEAQSLAQSVEQQSEATSRELASVREEISRLRSEAGQAIQSTTQQHEAEAHQAQNRVDATVAQFEAMGAETSARAQHAQQSSAEALQQAREAASIGIQAGSVASEAHSHGTEALRRTEVLMKKQTEEMDEMKQQMQSMRKMQQESQDLVKQLHGLLVKTQEQLKTSHENVVSMHNQLQTEKERVAAMEKQLQEERDRTTHLTNTIQQVQVDAAAQAEIMNAQAASGSNTAGPNLEIYRLVEQQRELLTGYQELTRVQAQKQASTSGSSSGHRLQIQMKPKEPPTFTGRKDQDVDIWLHQVEDYFALTKPSDEDGVAYLVLLLSHFARDWWEAEVKAHRGRQPSTIEEMKMLLREAFSSPLRERHARAEIRNLRQKQGEDYREYASRFKSLLARLPAGSYSDAIAMDDWIFGLNPPYGERVMALKPKTLQEAISIMGELDIAHQFCRRDGRGQTSQTQSGQSSGGGGGQKGKNKHQKKSGGAPGSGSSGKQSGQPQTSSGNNKGSQPGNSGNKGKGESDKSQIQCYYCGNIGHKKSECRKFARDTKAKIGTLQAQLAAARAQASQGAGQQPARSDDPPSRKN